MSFTAELIETIDVGNTLGEGVLWRQSDQSVWWTDIQESALYRLAWPSGTLGKFELPERLGSFGFVEGDDSQIIAAFASGFALYKPETAEVRWLCRPSELANGRRLNDGKTAPDGTFWAGAMLERDATPEAIADTGLYRIGEQGARSRVWSGLEISNGLAWSPAGDVVYFSDSAASKIYRADAPGPDEQVADPQVFAALDDGSPDGATTDKMGRYWCAVWGGGRIDGYRPDGVKFGSIPVPAVQPTCLAFGGSSYDLLFVTSAREGLSIEDLKRHRKSGSLFIFKTNLCGMPNKRYRR